MGLQQVLFWEQSVSQQFIIAVRLGQTDVLRTKHWITGTSRDPQSGRSSTQTKVNFESR